MTACLDTYWQAVLTYWQDQVMPQLAALNTEVIISGGASSILRSRLSAYFTELGLFQQVLLPRVANPTISGFRGKGSSGRQLFTPNSDSNPL
ncbi:MAG TPA: hypothetical protein VEZ50_08815 [Nodosilinea sp.]|nr:hypothetical protein [Nodosilinea sp.]